MYLKRIETIGFKSFADKTVVQFEPGVTAVVGPNGSGKSNISDSIRWVLGEQSAKNLRGGKMEDIIFAGTSTRKPLNFAEVTLVLDNSSQSLSLDFEEVSITRRVYRSGDSEYLINKQKVRLKDVVDLIMDTGIGHDSLSIISQDKVKSIVESRDEDRRTIIEEAAGVLKYKMRKKEATRKLRSTGDNLNRVQDIIYELEDQVEPLRKQSEKAEQYMELKNNVSDSEISVLAYDIKTMNDQLIKDKKEKTEFEFQNISTQTKIGNHERERNQLKNSKENQEETLEHLQKELVEVSETIQKLQGQRDVLKERHKNASSNKEQLATMQKEFQARLTQNETELSSASAQVNASKKELNEKNIRLAETTEHYQHLEENLKKQLESLRVEHNEDVNELTNVKNQYITVGERLQTTEQTIERLQEEREKLTAEQEAFETETNGFQKKYNELEKGIQEKNKAHQALKLHSQKQQKELEMESKHHLDLTRQLDKLTNRLQWLEDAQKDFSGFNEGVKKILTAREQNQIHGIEGAVAELVRIPKELELAMDVVLGPAMQQIVTTTDESAKGAIQYLKQNRAGRATFLPLNVIKSRQLPETVKTQFGKNADIIGVASDLVAYDGRYRQIFENLLGSIIVTKHLNAANQLAKQLNYRYRIVTLEGDVVNAGGSMTGGAVRRQGSSLLRQKNEIEECKTNIQVLEKDVQQSKTMQEQSSLSLEEIRKQIVKVQNSEEKFKEKLNEFNQKKVAFDYRGQALALRTKDLKNEVIKESSEMKRLANLNNELADRRIVLEEKTEASERQLKELESQLEQQEELKTQLLQEITELKIDVAKLEAILQGQTLVCERLKDSLEEAKKRLKEVLERISTSDKELLGSDDEVINLETSVQENRIRREEIIEEIQERRLTLTKVNQELEVLDREVRESRKIQQNLTELINQKAVTIGKLDVEIDLMIKKIEEEYEMTFDYANEFYPLKGIVSEIKDKIRKLKNQMNALGEVNLGAIQEYQRVRERYDFLIEQRDDLIEAKTNLEETIHEMDQEMTIKFKETFDAVRVQYIEIFKQLFGGGNADLVLTDPHDLLNTGVEIVAQPPGTKLKTSNLLSGGQKALTSIALLFAILRVRTVPFCVLDEVEAALDEANVARYANYLKMFSKETQFVVITHRKGTMESADVLYGVTMQERGVTKLVSVRMENVSEYLDDESA